MFDIGFWEILIIGVVTLLVVGPQRLPGVAVFAGHWVGRIRRFARNMRDEISEELETEHLKSLVEEQNREIDELRRDVAAVRGEAERSFEEAETAARADPGATESGATESGETESTATGSTTTGSGNAEQRGDRDDAGDGASEGGEPDKRSNTAENDRQ